MKIVVSQPPPYVHLTVADRKNEGWQLQEASARRQHSDHLLNFITVSPPFHFSMKMDRLKTIAENLPKGAIVVMIDAFDVLFNSPINQLVTTFQALIQTLGADTFSRKASIVFNGEKNCWPHQAWRSKYPSETLLKPYPFLNSGVLVGFCEPILSILNHFPWDKNTDDQAYWMQAYFESLQNPELPRIEVDHLGALACCMYQQPLAELACRDEAIVYRGNGSKPCLVHFNGPSKNMMRQVAKQLGIQLQPPLPSENESRGGP